MQYKPMRILHVYLPTYIIYLYSSLYILHITNPFCARPRAMARVLLLVIIKVPPSDTRFL